MAHTKKNVPNGTDALPQQARPFKAALVKVIQEYKESEEGLSQPLESLSPVRRKQVEAKLILKATKGQKKNRIFMQPRCTVTEVLGSQYRNEWSDRSSTFETQPNYDPGVILRVYDDVTAMKDRVDSLPSMTRNEIKAEAHRLAADAYPDIAEHGSRLMRDQYVSLATPMLSRMLQGCQKFIEEDARDMGGRMDMDDIDDEELLV